MNTAKNLNFIKLLIIVIIVVGGIWYINNSSLKNEKFIIPNNTIANILPPIRNVINTGYNKLNDNRFATLDNQMRLVKLGERVNKLLENIQQSFKLSDTPSANTMTFY